MRRDEILWVIKAEARGRFLAFIIEKLTANLREQGREVPAEKTETLINEVAGMVEQAEVTEKRRFTEREIVGKTVNFTYIVASRHTTESQTRTGGER